MFTPYMEKIDPEAVEKLNSVRSAVDLIPNMNLPSGKELSCHIVCRLISQITDIEFRDGYCGSGNEHCWLVLPGYIIDPYPIGVLHGPIIISSRYSAPYASLYKEENLEVISTKEFSDDLAYAFSLISLQEEKA